MSGRAKRVSIEVAGEVFSTKKALTERCQGILYAAGLGVPLAPEESRFLLALLQRHPEATAKIGIGVASFERAEEYRGTRHFVLVRRDGTRTDFSFRSCITPPTLEHELRSACRNAVRDDIVAFKTAQFATTPTLVCPIRGCLIRWENAHVDHDGHTFEALADTFLRAQTTPPAVEPTKDNDVETRFADPAVRERFREYHEMHAKLRVVSVGANLSDLRRRGP